MTAQQTVTVEVRGQIFSGTYSVVKEFLSVSLGKTSRTTIYHGVTPRRMARMLLRQIALRHAVQQR
jgi:hypothetical protein